MPAHEKENTASRSGGGGSSTDTPTQGGESAGAATTTTGGTVNERTWYPDDTRTAKEAFTLASQGGRALSALGRVGTDSTGFMNTPKWNDIQDNEKKFYECFEKQKEHEVTEAASIAGQSASSAGDEKRA